MTENQTDHQPEAPNSGPRIEVDDRRRVWQSDELLSGETEAIIVHRGQVYRLRCTKQGKLILYK